MIMYLISAYFDDETNKRIQQYIDQVAKRTGNTYMQDSHVPPHITISSFHTKNIDGAISLLKDHFSNYEQGPIQWTSVSAFLPYVLYIAPVLNAYLHRLNLDTTTCIAQAKDIKISPYHQPFSWMPHTTICKKLTPEEMQIAFLVLQHQFGPFEGKITRIGLAKTRPYEDIISFDLK